MVTNVSYKIGERKKTKTEKINKKRV